MWDVAHIPLKPKGVNGMQKKIFLSVFILLAFSITFGATAETPVIGFIAQDTTWTQANSPYATLGNIIVQEGVTLTIEPGVTVQFDSGHSLTIEGTLIARGTDKQGIKFTPKGEQKLGAWGGILFEASSTDAEFDDAGNYISGSILQYCTVEFATTAVKANSASPFIDHCVIINNGGGISISKGNIVVIRDSSIADNEGSGMFIGYSGSVTITRNTVTENSGRGISVENSDNVTLIGNSLIGNGGGIYVKGGTVTISHNILTGNTATGSSGGGIYITGGTATISSNTLTGNIATSGGFEGGDGYGGGICVGGIATISNNTLTENKALGSVFGDGRGGGIYIDGTATVSNNTLTGNMAKGGGYFYGGDGYGGGIYLQGDVTISNNALIGNMAKGGGHGSDGHGGGIYVKDGATAIISNNALTRNMAKGGKYGYGGGIYVYSNGTITGNIIVENHSSYSAAIRYSGSQYITGNLIVSNVAEGSGDTVAVYIVGNPKFTRNAIIGNQTTYNLEYGEEKGFPNLNATNNYWGVTTEAEIRVKIYDFFADNSKAFVDVVPFLVENPLSLGSLTVAVSPKALPADGKSTATITATLKDSKGNPVVDEPLTMVVSQGTGRLSEVKNNKDGTYTATYTASRTVGSEIIFISAPKSYATKSIEIQLTEPGVLPPKTLAIPDTEATAGGTVDIPVEIDGITGLAKAEIDLGYDAKLLEIQDVSGTDLIEGLTLTTAVLAGKIFLEGAKGLVGGSGAMFHVTFKIAKDAPVGETEIEFESIALYDEAGKEIPSSGTNGKLNVKEYQPLSSFTLSLDEGINIVSLPVQPQTPFTARSFAEKLSATMVINYDGKQGGFIAFVPEVFKEDGFSIEGGKGYIVNLLESKEVSFTGTVWSNAPSSISASPSKKDSHWAFVVVGLISTEPDLKEPLSELRVTVKNQRTNQLSQCTITDDFEFATAFVDMSRKSVVRAGDMLEITVRNNRGQLVSVPVVQEVSKVDLTKATFVANLRLGEVIPSQSQLFQNYPNPFNPETWIPFQLAESAEVTIRIYNVAGQLVRMLNLGQKTAGRYLDKTRAVYWDGRNELREKVSSGVYVYSIEAGNFRATKKLVVAK